MKEATHLWRGIKQLTIAVLLLCSCYSVQAGGKVNKDSTNVRKLDYFIDEDQKRIDLLDGIEDGIVSVSSDESNNGYAGRIYFTLIDSIQRVIESPTFDEGRKKVFRDNLYMHMRKVNPRSYKTVKRFDNLFHFILSELNAIQNKTLYNVLSTNITQSFNTIGFFKAEAGADSFMLLAARYRPDLVFKTYDIYYKQPYTLRVLETAAKAAPVTVKRYLSPNDPIYLTLQDSRDTIVKMIMQIKEKYGRTTNAFTLIDPIANGKMTMAKADETGKNPEKYLRAMLNTMVKKHPLGEHSLEAELEIYSLKFVRVLNDLHNETDAVRFASIENFSAEELYTLMVYSEEEIFTSTFNGLFNRLLVKLGPVSGFEFLRNVGDNRFRTFIKMSAGFGKLRPFLQSMTPTHQQMLMIKFASGLEQYNDLSQAVEVADAFGSITDSLVLKILRSTIKIEYIRLKGKRDARGMAIYGLLSNLFVEKNIQNSNWFESVSKQYSLPSFDHIANDKLFDRDRINRWLIYFYDDEDGDASFASFIKTFKDDNWNVIDSVSYVIIQSKKGSAVDIYANKPKHEYDGQEKLEKIFADNEYEPNVMVHRGHSYYAGKTIDKIKDNTQIFILGSCGGYHSISTIIERSSEASIVSAKQIGTMHVNNPMLKLIADDIREGKDIEWQGVWNRLGEQVKGNAKAYERYMDYIPPHKNLGAIFIKTYNRLMEIEL